MMRRRLRLIAVLLVLACALTAQASPRQRESFNAGWRFHFGSAADAEQPAFDDAGWTAIGLPHSFSLPYFQSASFPVGEGWYRKAFELAQVPAGRRVFLEFEGAFQVADVYVNGQRLATHRGGYTGFSVDLTPALKAGRNLVAVRVDNRWEPTLAPRAGEHVFSGGLYRDVWLVQTRDVHVPWTGTRITTPELSAEQGTVVAETEVRNDAAREQTVVVRTDIVDANGARVSRLPETRLRVPAGRMVVATQRSAPVARPALWSPETPRLYRALTQLIVDGRLTDRFETEFGFRWTQWTADKGFFLNGQHHYFRGANVHQDQAGWGDAVTNAAIERDVALMKDAGFDFIRGSHYPHDPHFATATDHLGLLFLSEAPFWGTAGFKSPWGASAYPTDPAHEAGFEASVLQQLAEMIRIHRNHPSIVAWSMGNEAFFTADATLPKVRKLLKAMVALSHELDPSRPAAVSGVQRGELDRLGDIAGYNGDGAVLFPDPGVPNFVAEYGSTIADRPGEFAPGWGDLERTPGARPGQPDSWRPAWRSGEAIWAGFDHGSIAGRQFGSMGLVDYFRLPKRQWYWYRQHQRGIAPPAWPEAGRAAALRLASSAPAIRRADGTDDVQLVVTVVDAQGRPLSNSPPVHLEIESGPGELPTGRAIDFAPGSDIAIRDGQAAIAMRSWQAGVSRLRASSPSLRDATLDVPTLAGPAFRPGVTPLAPPRPYHPAVAAAGEEQAFGRDNPTEASSAASGHAPRLVNDGDAATCWQPEPGDGDPWIALDLERIVAINRVVVRPCGPGRHALQAEVQQLNGQWLPLAASPERELDGSPLELPTEALTGRRVRLKVRGGGIAEFGVFGRLVNP
ncbi:glycoside hydrolase family 2 protein [Roseateles sp.]|uniref:glycoside hydrolase family 2 protein n=1 Tax=Roseateles sp. TaxID=1971397 RepID=UPI002DF78107|nr:glycoside hydrolase family 2 TIM barrel-domain containing protein [Roseateles sp.]HEV6964668.1 glycoside hydrolase family 2 TIM barrel-domain containing protein [Roseateles sp.]